jgi:UrcA family protein
MCRPGRLIGVLGWALPPGFTPRRDRRASFGSRKVNKSLIFAAVGALAAASLAGSAFAQGEAAAARSVFHEQTAVPVTYGDLDLASNGGASTMLDRLHRAAMDACGASDFSVKDYRWAVARSSCVRSGVAEAVAALDAPTVTQLYAEETAHG